jgi:prolycopene isomerase
MEAYDVVVIGAGNGGLTASAALARKGLKVLLLERHNIPGGCATSFCRGRFEFEVALHQLSGLGTPEKPGPLRFLLGNLGVLDALHFVEIPELYGVSMPDGLRMLLPSDRSQVVEELSRRFPKERQGIEAFLNLCYDYAQQMLAAFYFKDPDPSREKYPVLYEYAFKPAIEVLDRHFSDPLLKTILSLYWGYLALPPSRLSFAYLAMLYFTYLEFKPFHIRGGSQALSNALVNRLLASGGTVRFNCGASRILVERGEVRGVVTEHGDHVPARHVVSNASMVSTYVQLIGQDQVPSPALLEMRGRTISPSALTLFIGLDCEPSDLGITACTNFLVSHQDIGDGNLDRMWRREIGDDLMVMSCYDVADPEFSPPGACQLNVVSLKYGEPWLRVPANHYYQEKYRAAETMLQRLEALYPGLRGHIEEIEAATPVTFMRYLGHPGGAIYGFEQYTKDSMFFQPARRSPIEGLYFASGWVGDCGFQSTLQAGMSAANTILKRLDAGEGGAR